VPGTGPYELFRIAGALVGVSVCEDVWFDAGPVRTRAGPAPTWWST